MNPVRFSNREYTEMHFVYGEARGNAERARRIYMNRYPDRRIPSANTFINLHRRLIEQGNFKVERRNAGRPARIAPARELEILEYFEANPRSSTREAARLFYVSRNCVWKLLKRQSLHPYHFLKTHDLLPDDYGRRVNFCRIIGRLIQTDERFLNKVLWTDEALFTRMGVFNSHNMHTWAEQNPHSVMRTHFQHNLGINVWVGLIGNYLIGPFILPRRLNGDIYLNFLQNQLPQLLEDLPLNLRNILWYMHDGAPPHFAAAVRRYLDNTFPGRWMGRGQNAPVSWPSRSPDLNPIDFYFWGHIKTIVYSTPVNNEEELTQRIMNASNEIRNSPEILGSVILHMRRRLQACITHNGGYFEQFL